MDSIFNPFGKVFQPFGGGGRAYDYYIDSVAGDDTNSGRTPALALKTIAALPTITDGMRIGLACGSHFREKLDIGADNVYVGAYGTGAKPDIDAADTISSAWIKLGGYTNIWYTTVTIEVYPVVPADPFVRSWEDGNRMERATGLAGLDATPGSYLPDTSATTPVTLYIHASDSSDPSTSGKVYEYNRRSFAYKSADQEGCTLQGVMCRRQLAGGGSGLCGHRQTLIDCDFNQGTKHNVIVGDGSYLLRVRATEGLHNIGGTLFVHNETSPAGLGITYIDCQAIGTVANDTKISGFYGHVNVGGTLGTITYRGCSAVNVKNGFDGLNSTGCIMENCTVDDTVTVAVYVTQNYTITDCDLRAKDGAFLFGLAGCSVSVADTDCRATAPSPAPIQNNGATGCSLVLDTCLFDKTTFNFWAITFTASGCSVDIQNCTFASSGAELYKLGADTTIVSDYNAFKSPSGWKIDSTTYNFAQWQALGHDAHSTHA